MKKLCATIGFLFLLGCSSKSKFPNDFSFKIKESYEFAYDTYDSQKNEYERNYTDGIVKIKMNLSEEEKTLIFNAFKEVNFESFPEKFESLPNSYGEIDLSDLPGSTTEISFTANGKTKTTYYNTSDSSEEYKLRTQNFRDFKKNVWGIILNKKQVKNLKKADWIFQ